MKLVSDGLFSVVWQFRSLEVMSLLFPDITEQLHFRLVRSDNTSLTLTAQTSTGNVDISVGSRTWMEASSIDLIWP